MNRVLKNPNRVVHAPMQHEPEWKRLNREPVHAEQISKEFSGFVPRKGQKSEPKSPMPNVGSHNWHDPQENSQHDNPQYDAYNDPRLTEEYVDSTAQAPAKDTSKSNNLMPGQYAIMYNGQIVTASFDISEMETVIEDMIQKDILVDDIILLKRVKLKVGVIAE